jgi:macrolide transport system ATP-binding/permease protein
MGRPVIEVEGLTRTYAAGSLEVPALRSVSLSLQEGEFVAVMGPSGSGKSTFLNLIGCLDHPSSGTYRLDGTDVSTLSDDELAAIRSRKIGFVFQGFNLLARTNARQNVELPLVYSGTGHGDGQALRLLEAVGLPDRWSHTPGELSGGEQQRVAIARALVNSPAIILADEPTGNLDSRTSDEIMDIFLSLNQAGITILMVTHEENVAAYAQRLIRFKDGRVVHDEPVAGRRAGSGGAVDLSRIKEGGAGEGGRPAGPQAKDAAARRRSVLSPRELWENLRSAARSLWQNRLRAVLTILGIFIGVGAVIAMVSVGQGTTVGVQQRIESLGSNLLSVVPGSFTAGGVRQGFGSSPTLTYQDADAIRQSVDGVVGVEPEMNVRRQVRYRRANWSTSITGTSADYPAVRNWPVESGSFFTDEDYRAKRAVAVLGQDVVDNLFAGEDPVGKMVKIGDGSFRVVGVLQRRGGGGFFSQDDTVLIPLTVVFNRFSRQKNVRSIGISVADKTLMDQAKQDIDSLLRQRHRIPDGADSDFSVFSQQDVLQTAQGVSQMMTLLLGAIAGISLLVGGIGIMNIMLVTVTERTREIGIRKALGARRRDIMAQFLLEAVVLSGLGGILGWALGTAAARLISVLGNMAVVITGGTVFMALGFAVAVGLFFGLYPARKAARMDPIQALRFE